MTSRQLLVKECKTPVLQVSDRMLLILILYFRHLLLYLHTTLLKKVIVHGVKKLPTRKVFGYSTKPNFFGFSKVFASAISINMQ